MKRTRGIDYKEECRKRTGRPFLFIDLGLAKKYGNDFAIYIENLVLNQQYFQKKYPRYRGKFFLTYKDQIEQTRLSKYSLKRCKELAGFGKGGLRIVSSQMKSTKPQGHKISTKEWLTIDWKTLLKVYQDADLLKGNQESAMSKSDGHSKIVIFDKYDVNAIESVFLMENECPTENEGIIYRLLRKSHLKEKEEIINKNIAPKKELKPVPIKLKCPLGYIFGEDNGKFPECDTCEIVDECGEMQHYMKYPNQYSSNSDVT